MSPMRLAWLNLIRRRVTSVIAIVAIALSVACNGILLRLYLVSENRFKTLGAGGDAIVGAKAGGIEILLGALNGEGRYPGFLPYKLFQSLEAQQGVQFEDGASAQPTFIESIIPILDFGRIAAGGKDRPKTAAGVPDGWDAALTAGGADQRSFHVIGTNGRFIQRPRSGESLRFAEGHWVDRPDQVVIGSLVANQFHLHLGDKITVTVAAGSAPPLADSSPIDVPLIVAGILRPTKTIWDREAYTSVETAQRCLSVLNLSEISIWGSQVLNYFLVYLKPNGEAALEALVNRRTVGQVVMVEEAKAQLNELTGTGKRLGIFVTGLTLLLGGLAVAAMLITRFEAMASQLAVLRAIGYQRKVIASWLLCEGLILGTVACVLGAAIDAIGFPGLRSLLGAALPSPELVDIGLWESAPVWAAAILATIASVFIPLLRVYRQDVHFSLRD